MDWNRLTEIANEVAIEIKSKRPELSDKECGRLAKLSVTAMLDAIEKNIDKLK